MEKQLTVDEMLERWGLRVVGGSLKSPWRISTGGEAGWDDDLRLVDYVESTPGFERAAPILRHRFSEGRSLESFRVSLPGESRARALIRLGWFDLNGLADAAIPGRVLEDFVSLLNRRMAETPFVTEGSGEVSAVARTNSHKLL